MFKFAFKKSMSIALLWLLHFSLAAFWFQWVSNIALISMLTAFLMLNTKSPFSYPFSRQFTKFFSSRICYSSYLLLVSIFLFYGAYIGYFTAQQHVENFRGQKYIEAADRSKEEGNCSKEVYDFGKGGIQFSQKFLGFHNYFKDQVITYGQLNTSDLTVLEWHLCAADEIIKKGSYSLELLNVYINVLSMISVLPGEMGDTTRLGTKYYIENWENKLNILLSLAPKRVDQATPLISFYVKNANDKGVNRVCNKIERSGHYQAYCDLALGSILLKNGNFEQGMNLINRANDNGVLNSSDVDKATAEALRELLLIYNKP